MAVYSIKDLEKLSGIKAHTLRIWEQRYKIIQPKRTDTNIRYYLDEDLRLLLNIALLNKNGYKISKIAKMSEVERMEKVAELSSIESEFATQFDALTISTMEMDEYKFNNIISAHIRQLGFERTMLEIIYPFIDKLGRLWSTGSIKGVQESFITNLIRQKVIAAINAENHVPKKSSKSFLIYLPQGERQELSILFMHYLIKKRGHRVIYLGLDVNFNDLQDVAHIHRPDVVFTLITETFLNNQLNQYVEGISSLFFTSTILVSGYQVVMQNIQDKENVRVLKSLEEMNDYLNAS